VLSLLFALVAVFFSWQQQLLRKMFPALLEVRGFLKK